MTYSEILKKIRKENFNISQAKLAYILGVNLSVINNIENNKAEIKYDLAKKLYEKFNYDIDKLLEGELIKQESASEETNAAETIINELNLTPSEFDVLKQALFKDKTLIITLANAIIGDNTAMERIKKLLS